MTGGSRGGPWGTAAALARPAAWAIGPLAAFWLVEHTGSFF